MKRITHWIPTAYCAVLSLISILAAFYTSDHEGWRPVFFGFLPLCFMFVAHATTQMHREMRELRQRIIELEEQRTS